MSKQDEFDAVIERHKEQLQVIYPNTKLTGFHIDYNMNSTPEELETALNNYRMQQATFDSIDAVTQLEARVEQLEEILKNVAELGKTNVRAWVASDYKIDPELSDVKRVINNLTAFYGSIDQAKTIEFARKKGVIK